MKAYIDLAQSWWGSLEYSLQYNIWLAGGLGLLMVALVSSYYLIRWALGHRKFGGVWLNGEQFQNLLNSLIEEQQTSRRVLNAEELRIVRKALLGDFKPLHRKRFGGYF